MQSRMWIARKKNVSGHWTVQKYFSENGYNYARSMDIFEKLYSWPGFKLQEDAGEYNNGCNCPEVGKAQPPQLWKLRCALIFYFETLRKLRCGLKF